jgi:aminopeptidase-like protein
MNKILNKLFDDLWPICRSLAGPGFDKSLQILKKHIPFKIIKIRSGKRVYDWKTPKEWELLSAELFTEKGKLILSTKETNLHVLNFSEPYSGLVSFKELNKHLYSNKDLPGAVPYVTSYYKNNWGLCISHNKRRKLNKKIKYRVVIKTKKKNGFLKYGSYFLKGKTKETIIITSYLCHPSMANNELSGPLAMVALYKKLLNLKIRHFNYHFLIWPETIGAISFLANTKKNEIKNIFAGLVLSCLGGPQKKITFKHSRKNWLGEKTYIDNLVNFFVKKEAKNFNHREFSPVWGSDERQLCSPKINLPVVQVSKTFYGEYKEYHTSYDNKSFMNINSITNSVEDIFLFIRFMELNRNYLKPVIKGGEPMLSKRGLYPSVNTFTKNIEMKNFNNLFKIISLIDGKRNLIEIFNFLNISIKEFVNTIELLQQKHLIKF